jgi:hypothetical protein
MKAKIWKMLAALILPVLAVGALTAGFAAPKPAASLVLVVDQAALTLSLDAAGKVTGVEGQGLPAGFVAGLNISGQPVAEALRVVAGALHAGGKIVAGSEVAVAVSGLDPQVAQTISTYLAGRGVSIELYTAAVTPALLEAAQAARLSPDNLSDLVELAAAVGPDRALLVLNLRTELTIAPWVFREEFGTLASALIDMAEAGIAKDEAVAILRKAAAAGVTLEEVSTITAAMIDLHEAGVGHAEMKAVFAILEEQIAAGLSRKLVLEEFTTITAAKIDLVEAGIAKDQAMAIVRKAIGFDPSLEEFTTITAALIDLVEQGLTKEQALAKIQAAIQADPTLENLGEPNGNGNGNGNDNNNGNGNDNNDNNNDGNGNN